MPLLPPIESDLVTKFEANLNETWSGQELGV